jgi:hypothetical protein
MFLRTLISKKIYLVINKMSSSDSQKKETRAFNQLTNISNDVCSYGNSLRISTKPIKYYVNEYNSPEVNPFETYAVVGNLRQYDVRNDYERPLPSRLNPLYQSYVTPYETTPFLANQAENRSHTNTSSQLRWGQDMRATKSAVGLGDIDYNRWAPNVSAQTVQNAGQFTPGAAMQSSISRNGEFDPLAQNNILFMNSSVPINGVSTRNELHNFQMVKNC